MSWRLRAHSQSVYNLNRHQATTETRAGPSEAIGRGMDRPGAGQRVEVRGGEGPIRRARPGGVGPGRIPRSEPPGGSEVSRLPGPSSPLLHPSIGGRLASTRSGRPGRSPEPYEGTTGAVPRWPRLPSRLGPLSGGFSLRVRAPARPRLRHARGARGRIMRVEGPTRPARPVHRPRVPRACACPSACARA
jgi:hypothetical protein